MAAAAKWTQNREVSPAGERQQQQHIVVVSHNSSSKREKNSSKNKCLLKLGYDRLLARIGTHTKEVFGVLQQDKRLHLLPGDQHLIPARPRGQGVRRSLRSVLGHLHGVAGAQHRGIICVDVRGVIRGAESPSQSSVS